MVAAARAASDAAADADDDGDVANAEDVCLVDFDLS